MTALVDRLEQLHAEATPGPWDRPRNVGMADVALIVELRNALPALLTALRAADHHVSVCSGETEGSNSTLGALADSLAALFGEDDA